MIADLFSTLPPLQRHFVLRILWSCPRTRLSAGEARRSDDFPAAGLLVVESGTVAVVCGPRLGRRIVVAVAASGGVLAVPVGDQRLIALQDAAVLAVAADARRCLLGLPAAAEAIVEALLAALGEREESLAQFASVAHVERVRRKLLQLARVHGSPADGGVEVELPLTHALLAEMVGSARETVTGAVKALEREGFLVREDGRYRLMLAPEVSASAAPESV